MELPNNVITWHKLRGETPLEALNRLRTERSELADERLSYAGRLDPIAEGVLLVLVGDANNEREKYLALDKEYVVDVLWGVSTDTHDILGIPSNVLQNVDIPNIDIEDVLSGFVGTCEQKYPVYSSRTVNGTPLWEYAREGRLDEIDIPTHEVTIYDISYVEMYMKSVYEVQKYITETVGLVKGDFRQNDIAEKWEQVFRDAPEEMHFTRFCAKCSSGTYIRQLVADIGENVGVPACVFYLKRTKINVS